MWVLCSSVVAVILWLAGYFWTLAREVMCKYSPKEKAFKLSTGLILTGIGVIMLGPIGIVIAVIALGGSLIELGANISVYGPERVPKEPKHWKRLQRALWGFRIVIKKGE